MGLTKPNQTSFKPGNKANPRGAGAHDPKMKALKRRLCDEEVAELATMILDNNLEALMAIKEDANASVLKIWYASIAANSIKKGDPYALDVLLNRILGKPREFTDITSNGQTIVQSLTDISKKIKDE